MEKMGVPSPEEQSKIQEERTREDVNIIKGGGEYKEDGHIEITAEQMEAVKKATQAESPEVKSLEALKRNAIKAGVSPENIKALDMKLEMARDGGESFIAKKEEEYKKAQLSELELKKSIEEGGAFYEKAEKRKGRDFLIGAVSSVGVLAASFATPLVRYHGGMDLTPDVITAGIAIFAGLSVSVGMLGAPIARIQNWFGRKKIKEDISQAEEKTKKARDEENMAQRKVKGNHNK